MIEIILAVLLFVFSLSFLISYGIIANEVKELKRMVTKIMINGMITEEFLKAAPQEMDETVVQQESFIKFLSDSRTWAFDYIENIQAAIKLTITSLDSVLKNNSIKEEDMNTIRDIELMLKSFLPEGENDVSI